MSPPRTILTLVTLLALVAALAASPPRSSAQQAVWGEPVIVTPQPVEPGPATQAPRSVRPGEPGSEAQTRELRDNTVRVDELARPLSYDEVVAINRVAVEATVPVRVRLAHHPMVRPTVEHLDGVAVWVEHLETDAEAGGGAALVTSLSLVGDAESLEIYVDGRWLAVEAVGDARYGLAAIELPPALRPPATSLELLPVEAGEPVETFSTPEGSAGAAVGAGPAQYGFYQLNTLGVTLGYPLVNRRGQLVGVGSHRYPVDPAYALSVPAASVDAFLDALDETAEGRTAEASP